MLRNALDLTGFSQAPAYEVTMTMHCVKNSSGKKITEHQLKKGIKEFQTEWDKYTAEAAGVCVKKGFIQFKDSVKDVWELTAINYPRRPQQRHDIKNFMIEMARDFLGRFEQDRITICYPEQHLMLERPNAEAGTTEKTQNLTRKKKRHRMVPNQRRPSGRIPKHVVARNNRRACQGKQG